MFEGLSEKLSGIFDKLTRRGALSEDDVNAAMREVRRALLEADVALDVVREFTDKVRARAVGANVVKSVTPGQMVVKIVNDVLVETLGSDADPINLDAPAPLAMLRGRHRQRLLVHARRALDVQDVLRDWLGGLEWSRHVRVSVDIDPYSFV